MTENRDRYIVKDGKELRCGYTTGSCAAAAAAAAARALLTGESVPEVRLVLPNGEEAYFYPVEEGRSAEFAVCSVVKDGGDDPDVTTGAHICARVSRTQEAGAIEIDGGEGVGRVTAAGLSCAVGEAAINPVPRAMIRESVERELKSFETETLGGNAGFGLKVEIFVPEGRELAARTYNPRLGIEGGISILGTTGIVEPMSEKALVDTIRLTVDRQRLSDGEQILLSPGNYGKDFCREQLGLDVSRAVTVSNYIGEALDYVRYKGFKRILLVGHTGKLIKLAGGIMNTHSSYADARMEIIAAYSALYGANEACVSAILGCITTDEALDLIADEPFYGKVKAKLLERVLYHLNFRLRGEAEIGVVLFTSGGRHTMMSENARGMIDYYKKENSK